MKSITYILLIITMQSCSSLKTEQNIVIRDFLDNELASAALGEFSKEDFLLIAEAGTEASPLVAYQKLYHTRSSLPKFTWVLDSAQIDKLMRQLDNESPLYWRNSDFNEIGLELISAETNVLNYKNGIYITSPEKLILNISKPVRITSSRFILYFRASSSIWGGFQKQCLVIMKKKDRKWIPEIYYPIDNYFP